MKIGLIGYGRMGKEVERLAVADGHEIVWIADIPENASAGALDAHSVQTVDVCIEFTEPGSAVDNITAVLKQNGKVVSGTTGWHHDVERLRSAFTFNHEALVFGSNFSIGIHLFRHIIRQASTLMSALPDMYDVAIHEIHHRGKVDHPSGTARDLGGILLEELPTKLAVVSDLSQGRIEPEDLHVSSTRIGSVPGIHTVYFDSPFDTIELRHSARSRMGFARGALLAAEWVKGRSGIFQFQEVITSILKERSE